MSYVALAECHSQPKIRLEACAAELMDMHALRQGNVMFLCAKWQALVTAMQHVYQVSREQAERLFSPGVQYTEEEREGCGQKMEAMWLWVLLKRACIHCSCIREKAAIIWTVSDIYIRMSELNNYKWNVVLMIDEIYIAKRVEYSGGDLKGALAVDICLSVRPSVRLSVMTAMFPCLSLTTHCNVGISSTLQP